MQELRGFGESWSVGQTALREAIYVREFNADGSLRKLTLDPTSVIDEGGLLLLSLTGPAEHTSFVNFASELGDGEAEALALAHARKHLLLTDDGLATRVAMRREIAIPTVGTAEVLIAWAGRDAERLRRLPDIVGRITILAKYQPAEGHAHRAWWQGHLAVSTLFVGGPPGKTT
ncbi:MAG: hypothetical protein ACT4QA_13270 [Panacagrimonas sp.]